MQRQGMAAEIARGSLQLPVDPPDVIVAQQAPRRPRRTAARHRGPARRCPSSVRCRRPRPGRSARGGCAPQPEASPRSGATRRVIPGPSAGRACGPAPSCNGSTPSSTSRTRRCISASAIFSALCVALVLSSFMSSLASSPIEKPVGRGRALLGALAVKRPAEHHFRAAVIVGPQAAQPFVDQSRFARAALRDEPDYVTSSAQAASRRASSASRPTRSHTAFPAGR